MASVVTSNSGLVFALGERLARHQAGVLIRSPRWVSPTLNAGALRRERAPCLGCEQPHQAEAGRAST